VTTRRCWLVKTEPDCYSIDDLKRDGATSWSGVRNYQARNFMRDQMKRRDPVFIYHSGAATPAETGIVGVARIAREAHPDLTALDPKDDHFDPKSTRDNPIWMMVDIEYVERFPTVISLRELKAMPQLKGMPLLQPGQRLSVQPVDPEHFDLICALARGGAPKKETKRRRD
jgi:predicted RNA-binding protein with PUA-like domain